MNKLRIFISSVQKEFAAERRTLRDYIEGDALLRRFFRVIEKAGTGTLDMIALCAEAGLPPPSFRQDGGQFVQVLRRSKAVDVPPISPTQLPTQLPTQSTDPVIRLVAALQQGEKSSGELRSMLGIKHRPTFRDNYLHPAWDKGLIEYTIPDKPNSRLQKYRLTRKGCNHLAGRKP